MSRARGPVETIEYGKMVARMMRSWAKRVTHADEPELAQMIAAVDEMEEAVARAIYGQRTTYGRSWQDIANATGTTRQEACRRWGQWFTQFENEERARKAAALLPPYEPPTPRYPKGTPEYEAYERELQTELRKFVAGEPPYEVAR